MDGIVEQINERLHTLQWMLGLSIGWNTMLIAAAVGILLTYR